MINNQLINFFVSIAIIFPAFLIALSFHEFSHALVAHLLGDDTAKKRGRLTLNPFAHLDFWGTIFLIFFRIGWAKPVPFDIKNFKYPRLGSILTAFAGPAANFIIAFASFFILKYLSFFSFSNMILQFLKQIVKAIAYINVMLGVFNLLPIPPLDGSHLITALLYKRFPNVVAWLYRYSIFILLFLFFIPLTRILLSNLIFYVQNFIKNLVFNL